METAAPTAAFEKYPAYKDSGVDWLGEIPEHWQLCRFKFLFREINEKSPDGNGDLLSVSQYTGVTKKSDKIEDGDLLSTAATLEGYKKVYQNDLVTNIMLAWNGSLGFSPFDGITSPAYSVYRLASGNSERFFHYLVRSEVYKSEFKRKSSGVIESRLRLYTDDFYSIWSILPTLPEQTAIAQFLDDKTAKIDRAIAQKEKLITLLKERKQIIIQDLVTGKKVWNPAQNAFTAPTRVKPSGVEWIGEIPEGWEVKPGLVFFKENKRSNKGMKEGTVLSLSYGKVIIKPEEKLVGLVPESFETYQIVEPGDIIVRCTDLQNDQTSLRMGIAKDDGIITSAYINLGALGENLPEYLYSYLHFVDVSKALYKFGSGLRQNLSIADFKRMPILSVPLIEQQKIVEGIGFQSKKIDNAINMQERQIEKLKELKSSLIDAAVTGKIKVG